MAVPRNLHESDIHVEDISNYDSGKTIIYISSQKEYGYVTKTLILVVDRDDDFGVKGGVETPVIGIENAKEAAMRLGVVDPEDSDVNALFAAINIYNDLTTDNTDVEIALICGDKKVGHRSDSILISELEDVINTVKPDRAILVGDGAEDEYVYPIISSRVPVDSVRRVYVKQSPGIEGFVYILTKTLKDPEKKKRFLAPLGTLLCIIAMIYILANFFAFLATNSLSYIYSMTAPTVIFLIGGLILVYAYDAVEVTYGYIDKIRTGIKSPSITLTFKILSVLLFITAVVIATFSVKDIMNNGFFFVSMIFVSNFLWPFVFSILFNYMGTVIDDYVETKNLSYGLTASSVMILGVGFIVQFVIDFLKNYMGFGSVENVIMLFEFAAGVASIIVSSMIMAVQRRKSAAEVPVNDVQ